MADNTTAGEVVLAADGLPLKASLNRAMRKSRRRALFLVAPLFIFVLFSFLIPIFDMTMRSVDNWHVSTLMPETTKALEGWDGEAMPEEPVFAALILDLKAGAISREIGKVGTRLNYEKSGLRSMITSSARKSKKVTEGPYKPQVLKMHKRWKELETWKVIKRNTAPYTIGYYLNAVDMKYDNKTGDIVMQSEDRQIYTTLFIRTFAISLAITLICVVLAYPISYLLATLPVRYSNLLMIFVLLPFWTSLLVRTTAWIAMLQSQGVLNDLFVFVGLVDDADRLQLIHNLTGTIIAMTHILLPFMVLPLFSVMKTIPPSYMRAALSLGANPVVAFVRVYMPQTLSGIGAGSILVFILSIGYYITPALVGGTDGTLISNQIAYHMQSSLNWGLAGALGALLLFSVLALYLIYNKIVGIDNMRLG
ncbi:MAG: ABC transporter permease [Alphaproteobacteria bacterium]|nr:ABC transporter permease [Alphaproteobacteria bacterium]